MMLRINRILSVLHSLVLCHLLLPSLVSATLSDDLTGVDILKNQMNIRRLRAHFNFKENKVYYIVRFCGKKTQFCFVTKMDDNDKPMNSEQTKNVVKNINLWMKLISTINGKNEYNIIPVSKNKMSEEHDGRCKGDYYIIVKGPTKAIVKEILEEGKKRPKCLSKAKEKLCRRVCVRGVSDDQCDEIRLHCNFDGCKCYKRVNLRELRKSKSKTNSSS